MDIQHFIMQSYAYVKTGAWDSFLAQFAPDAIIVKDGIIESLAQFQSRVTLFYARYEISDLTIDNIRILNPDSAFYRLHLEFEDGLMSGRRLLACITKVYPGNRRLYIYRSVCADQSAPSTMPDQDLVYGSMVGGLSTIEDITVTTGQIAHMDHADPSNMTIVNADGRHWHKCPQSLIARHSLQVGSNVTVTATKKTIYDHAKHTDKTFFNIKSVVWFDARRGNG